LGLGRDSVGKLLQKEIKEGLPAGVDQVVVRYPRVGTSLGDRLQQSIWTWFFNDLDFIRETRQGQTPEEDRETPEVRLVYNLRDPHARVVSPPPGETAQGEPPAAHKSGFTETTPGEPSRP